ncbi:MAG: alanine--tRNA ligase-related protein, partial [Candidatus Rokuibacteriota bacterium]
MTELLYMDNLEDAYLSSVRGRIQEVGNGFVLLDRSIFYPEGGGQPSDRGVLRVLDPETGESRQLEVTKIEKKHGVRHLVAGDLAGVSPGAEVVEEI